MWRTIVGLVICGVCVNAQTARFEVVSIKPSNDDRGLPSGIQTGHGRLHGVNVTLKRCIVGAYEVGPNQISGGPGWMDSDRFEIVAKTDSALDDDHVFMMLLRDVLAERFKLVVHRETRNVQTLTLEVAKNGPKMEKSAGGEAVNNSSTGSAGLALDAHNVDMDSFARILSRAMDLPVVNRTRLSGGFNFKLSFVPENRRAANPALDGPSVYAAVEEQLGLRLRSEKAPVEMIVVESAERPTAN